MKCIMWKIMKIRLSYLLSFVLLMTLSACIGIIDEKKDDPPEEDELIRILNDSFPLMKAVKEGKVDEIKRLLKIEAFKKNVNQQDEDGNTALLFAAEYGFEDILNLLIGTGADPNLPDFKKRTPLMTAAYRGKANIVTKLLEIDSLKKNINAQDKDGDTALIFAAKRGYDNILDLLLQEGADPNLRNFKERTPLMEATKRGKANIVTKLLEIDSLKKNINAQDKDGDTALIFAAKRGSDDIMDLLLQAGADPNLSNFKERTPLMEATKRGKANIVTKLLKIKTVRDNIDAKDKDENTALSLANQEGYKQIASLLKEAGATPQPIKETYLHLKRIFKKVFFRQNTAGEENPLRKTATEAKDKKTQQPKFFFEKITSFFKNLF